MIDFIRRYRSAYAWGMIGSFVGFAASVVLMYAIGAPTPAYVTFLDDNASISAAGCPGERITQTIHLDVRSPAVVSVAVTIYGSDGSMIAPTANLFTAAIPTQRQIADEFTWQIPPLAPGTYTRTVGAITYGRNSAPAFYQTRFSVAEGCSIFRIDNDEGADRRLSARPRGQ